MTSTPDRRDIVALIDKSMSAGARQSAACAGPGPSERTLQRWTGPEGGVRYDHRPLAEHPEPASKLSEEERGRIVATCNAPEFASLPPSQIVPRSAGQGIWPRHLDSVGVQLLQSVARARPEPPPRACATGNQIETTQQL